MIKKNNNLTKLLAPYKKGWVALNKEQTKVIAHASTFQKINDKIKSFNKDDLVLWGLGNLRGYFVGSNFSHD